MIIGFDSSWKKNIRLDILEADLDLRIDPINLVNRIADVSGLTIVYGIYRTDVKEINIVLLSENRFQENVPVSAYV